MISIMINNTSSHRRKFSTFFQPSRNRFKRAYSNAYDHSSYDHFVHEKYSKRLNEIAQSHASTDVYHVWLKRHQSEPLLCWAILRRMKEIKTQQHDHPQPFQCIIPGQPDATTYTLVIRSFAKYGGNPQVSHDLLDELLELYQQKQQDQPKRSEEVDQNPSFPHGNIFTPTYECFDHVIQAWANCKSQPSADQHRSGATSSPEDMALLALQQLQAYSQLIPTLSPPDAVTWTHVMNAIRNNSRYQPVEAARRCQQVVQLMEELFQKGRSHAKPDARCYNLVLDAWAQAAVADNGRYANTNNNSDLAALSAESLLRHMQSLYHRGDDPSVKPTHVSYASCIHAWANTNSSYAANRAQVLYDEMMLELYHHSQIVEGSITKKVSSSLLPILSLPPPQHALGALLTAWNRSRISIQRPHHAAQRAQILYDQFVAQFGESAAVRSSDDEDDEMIASPLGSLLQAWAKAGNAPRAQALLQEWYQQYRHLRRKTRNTIHSKSGQAGRTSTDTILFTTVLDAWSRSGLPEAPDQAMSLFQQMQSLGVRTNLQTMTALITTWGRSRRPDRVEQAQAIFQKLLQQMSHQTPSLSRGESDHKGTNTECYVDENDKSIDGDGCSSNITIAYNAMLDTYAKGNRPEEAEALLREMKLSDMSISSFSSVLQAWSHSNTPAGGSRAQDILKWMQLLHQQGRVSCRPNTMTYNHVIRAWSGSILSIGGLGAYNVDESTLDAELAAICHIQDLTKEMKQRADSMPNIYTYIYYLQTLAKCKQIPNQAQHAASAIQEMTSLGVPTTVQVLKLAKSCGFINNKHSQASSVFSEQRLIGNASLTSSQDKGGRLVGALRRAARIRQCAEQETTVRR